MGNCLICGVENAKELCHDFDIFIEGMKTLLEIFEESAQPMKNTTN